MDIHSQEELEPDLKNLDGARLSGVWRCGWANVKKAPLPFTTSTLQQEASKALNFSTQKTMRLAQQLYEGVDIKGSGTVGMITYLRTDSVRISEEAPGRGSPHYITDYGKRMSAVQRKIQRKNTAKDPGCP